MTPALDGVVVVDKPVGPSSFDVVRRARALTGARKVGHGGTLDPGASGVLPICFGEATKIAQFLLDADKEYEATIRFGLVTDTYDATGTITGRTAAGHLTRPEIERAIARFQGWIEQRPPAYSALKRGGRPLYELARAGETIEVDARRVRIDAFEILDFVVPGAPGESPVTEGGSAEDASTPEHPALMARIACSKGTYIRSLAHDLGAALGTGAHLEALRRTRSGPFVLAQAIPPAALRSAADHLISPARALEALPAVTLGPALALAVAQGKLVVWGEIGMPGPGEGPVRLLDGDGALVAVAPRAAAEEPVRTLRVFNRDLRDLRDSRESHPGSPAAPAAAHDESIPGVSSREV